MKKSIKTFLNPDFNYDTSEKDKKEIEKDLGFWITKKITRKKFRKKSLGEKSFNEILSKVNLSISENKPLKLVFLFGGYKHFWNKSFPNVDWAEFFNILFLIDLFKPVLEIYKPGVVFDYASEDIIITKMNNYPKKSLDDYANSFNELLNYFRKFFPENFEINYVRTGEKYNKQELFQQIDEKFQNYFDEFSSQKDEEKELKLKRSYRSVLFKGEEDFSGFDEKEKKELVEKSKCVEDLFYEVEDGLIGEYYYGNETIPLVGSWGLSDENFDNWMTIGSTYSSSVDFWIGKGILEFNGNKFVPRVVSQNQYKDLKFNLEKLDFNFYNKNFSEIEVLI